jgi:hypothetical protein
MMKIDSITLRMRANAVAIRALVQDVGDAQARWRPGDGHWSILEVVTHLADEEPDDFRTRLRLTLEDPSLDWPSIDPQAWVTERRYNEGDLAASLARFEGEREASIEWLSSLDAPAWERSKAHPAGFSVHAGDLMNAWLAHDLAHIHQLAELQAAWLGVGNAPYETGYSGWDPLGE